MSSIPESLKRKLKSRRWRLNNLYMVRTEEGKDVRFRMRSQQADFYDNKHQRNILLKVRQLGFTTQKAIEQLDAAMFEKKSCAMICHTLNDATKLFDQKVMHAYDRLPDEIKALNPLEENNKSGIKFARGGSLYVAVSFRGGTLQSLHVSEFGKICAKDPKKAMEIVTGAFPAAQFGEITIESTAEGRAGYFFDYCMEAMRMAKSGEKLTIKDFKFFFYSWYEDPKYQIDEPSVILPDRIIEYFERMRVQTGYNFSRAQMVWYFKEETIQKDKMKREYPTTPEEAFMQSVIGAYYHAIMMKLYEQGRIGEVPDNPHLPVYTAWDLGVGDSTTIWFFRLVGKEIHVIDFYENHGEGLRHYMKVLRDKGYSYAAHYAPHDIDNREFAGDGKSRKTLAAEGYEIDGSMYYVSFEVLPRSGVDDGIELVRETLPRCVFDKAKCEQGIIHLENYKKEWDENLGTFKMKPLHDEHSHAADGFRYLAVAVNRIMPALNVEVSIF